MELTNPIIEFLLSAFFFIAGAAGLNLVSVEGVKTLLQWMADIVEGIPFLNTIFSKLTLSGRKTFFFSMVLAFFLIAGLDTSVLSDLSQFADVDPTAVNLVEGILVGLLSNHFHDKAKQRNLLTRGMEDYA